MVHGYSRPILVTTWMALSGAAALLAENERAQLADGIEVVGNELIVGHGDAELLFHPLQQFYEGERVDDAQFKE